MSYILLVMNVLQPCCRFFHSSSILHFSYAIADTIFIIVCNARKNSSALKKLKKDSSDIGLGANKKISQKFGSSNSKGRLVKQLLKSSDPAHFSWARGYVLLVSWNGRRKDNFSGNANQSCLQRLSLTQEWTYYFKRAPY